MTLPRGFSTFGHRLFFVQMDVGFLAWSHLYTLREAARELRATIPKETLRPTPISPSLSLSASTRRKARAPEPSLLPIFRRTDLFTFSLQRKKTKKKESDRRNDQRGARACVRSRTSVHLLSSPAYLIPDKRVDASLLELTCQPEDKQIQKMVSRDNIEYFLKPGLTRCCGGSPAKRVIEGHTYMP